MKYIEWEWIKLEWNWWEHVETIYSTKQEMKLNWAYLVAGRKLSTDKEFLHIFWAKYIDNFVQRLA